MIAETYLKERENQTESPKGGKKEKEKKHRKTNLTHRLGCSKIGKRKAKIMRRMQL